VGGGRWATGGGGAGGAGDGALRAGPLEAEPGVLEAELSEEEMEAELDWFGRCACETAREPASRGQRSRSRSGDDAYSSFLFNVS
jgi:hypothetical protein